MNGNEKALRLGTGAAVLLVAAIAAVISFQHIQHLALTHGQTVLASALLPLSIDGTVAAASLVMLRAARGRLSTPWLARGMLTLAVVATLAANIGYGWSYGLAGAALSGWPAVAFIGCAEMAIMMVRKTAAPVVPPVSPGRHEWQPMKVRDIAKAEGVSSRTAQKIRKATITAVKASQNGHDSA